MTVIPFIPAGRRHASLLFVFADFQREYLAEGRPHAILGAEPCIENCRKLLGYARSAGMPIVHFRQVRSGGYFNPRSDLSRWIEGFQPQTNEMLYERDQPSCYANRDFFAFLEHLGRPAIVLAGLAADQACLGTAVEAYRHDHRVFFVRDCSATAALGPLSEEQSHDALCAVIASYAGVVTLEHMTVQLLREQVRHPVAV